MTSGVTNITWSKQYQKWHVRISIDGARVHIGRYDDLERARQALKDATIDDME